MDNNDLRYDTQCKMILADKEYVSRILKALAWEYKDISLDEIKDKYLPTDIRHSVGSILVRPDITGRKRKARAGEVSFDVRFDCKLPEEHGKNIKLLINIEGQKSTKTLSYNPVTRGIFYSGVMLSSEYGSIVSDSHYEDLQKVYSIWICMAKDENREGSITRFKIDKEHIIGEGEFKEKDYDKLEVIIVELGRIEGVSSTAYNEKKLMELLNYTFSNDEESDKKVEGLKSRFGIDVSQELKEDIGTMCNFSEVIEERGIEKGIEKCALETASRLLSMGKLTDEEIASGTGLTIEQVIDLKEGKAS